jgi:tripartite-type tricarboxylate transporter receptor subunit TctC
VSLQVGPEIAIKMRLFRFVLMAFAAMLCGSDCGMAQSYPAHTITLAVPFPAGSTTDNVARKLADYIQSMTSTPVIVDNKPGADGNIAALSVLRAPADGYRIFVTTNSTHAANASIFKAMPFDPINDFEMIGGVMTIPMVLTVKPNLPATSLQEFVAEAKRREKPLLFGSGNTSTRGANALFNARYGIEMQHVPYRGTPQVVSDLLAGQIDCAFIDVNSVRALMQDGQLKGLASTSKSRIAEFPNIPTVSEALPGFEMGAWVGVVVHRQTPRDVVEKLNKLVHDFVHDPTIVNYLTTIGSVPLPLDSAQFRGFVISETQKWADIVNVVKIEKK